MLDDVENAGSQHDTGSTGGVGGAVEGQRESLVGLQGLQRTVGQLHIVLPLEGGRAFNLPLLEIRAYGTRGRHGEEILKLVGLPHLGLCKVQGIGLGCRQCQCLAGRWHTMSQAVEGEGLRKCVFISRVTVIHTNHDGLALIGRSVSLDTKYVEWATSSRSTGGVSLCAGRCTTFSIHEGSNLQIGAEQVCREVGINHRRMVVRTICRFCASPTLRLYAHIREQKRHK